MPMLAIASNCSPVRSGSRRSGSPRDPPVRLRLTRLRASCAWAGDSVMPSTRAPWRLAACRAKPPQPQPTSKTRSSVCSASFVQTISSFACCACSRSVRRARTARSYRSSTLPGTARRTRWRRRSDGAPRARRARGCGGARAARSSLAGIGGGAVIPQAPRTAAIVKRTACLEIDDRRLEAVEQLDHTVKVVGPPAPPRHRPVRGRAGRAHAAGERPRPGPSER